MHWYCWVLLIVGIVFVATLIFALGLIFGFLTRYKEPKKPKKNIFDPDGDWEKAHDQMVKISNEFLSLNPEKIDFKCSDGTNRRGYFLKNDNSDVLVVFSHGWRSTGLINFGVTGEYALRNNYNILLIDHYGHGESDGQFLGFGMKDFYALKEMTNFITNRENKDYKVFLHGVSMGSNIVMLSSDKDIKGLKGIIADCGFTSAWKQFVYSLKLRFHLPAFPIMYEVNLICRVFLKMNLKKYDTLDTVKNSNVPIFYIHGEKDDFVPTSMTHENASVTKNCEVWISEGCKHATTSHFYKDEYMERINEFINKNK